MRKLFALSLLLLFFSGGILKAQRIGIENPHELRLGVGIPLVWNFYGYDCMNQYNSSFNMVVPKHKVTTPALFVSYFYQFKNWFAFGGTVNYVGNYSTTYNIYEQKIAGSYGSTFLSITPTIRFDWLRTKWVKMYSSLGLGVNMQIDKVITNAGSNKYYDSFVLPSYEVTMIGLAVGRTVYGFVDFGMSSNSLSIIGVGYRFNTKRGE